MEREMTAEAEERARAKAKAKGNGSSRSRSVAFVGLTIAIMAVSAWVVVPLGPVPFTLQMFAVTFAIVVLPPKDAIAAIIGYVLLGAVGLPVFSGMRGGIGVLLGPTGGFLWGYLIGVPVAALLLSVLRRCPVFADEATGSAGASGRGAATGRGAGRGVRGGVRAIIPEAIAGILYVAIAYLCGWVQYMAVAHLDPLTAFLTSCAPFILVDLAKVAAAILCARAVRSALGMRP